MNLQLLQPSATSEAGPQAPQHLQSMLQTSQQHKTNHVMRTRVWRSRIQQALLLTSAFGSVAFKPWALCFVMRRAYQKRPLGTEFAVRWGPT